MFGQNYGPRGHRVSFRRDTRAVEGFMTEIPALALITFAITAFMISAVSATGMYLEDKGRVEAQDKARDISLAFRSYGPLVIDDRTDHLSASALDDLASGHIMLDIKNTGDMTIVVTELAQDRTENGVSKHWRYSNTDRHDVPVASTTNTVLVGHEDSPGPPVYYLAIMEVRTW